MSDVKVNETTEYESCLDFESDEINDVSKFMDGEETLEEKLPVVDNNNKLIGLIIGEANSQDSGNTNNKHSMVTKIDFLTLSWVDASTTFVGKTMAKYSVSADLWPRGVT